MENHSKNKIYHLVTLNDPECLPGKNISNILLFLKEILNFKYLIFDYIYGSGRGIISLEKKENEILVIDDIINDLSEVRQFDWGDFFLFKNYPHNWNIQNGATYPYVIVQSDTTLRAVDDQYIYIYTPYIEIINAIKENYQVESIKTDYLDNLDYPE